jgi:metallo-beta-lactamase family protein
MKIAFHGAAGCVTGSKHLLTLKKGLTVLLDCGMFQGMGKDTDALNRDFGFDAKSIDIVVLSHAHIDHSGLLPKLVKDGFAGKIYCTPATKDLATILLLDSAGIQENDLKFVNKKRAAEGLPYLEALYTEEDAQRTTNMFEERAYGEWFNIDADVQVMYTDAGHIIGSAAVHLKIKESDTSKTLTFSGDVGRYRDAILKSPETFPQADYIIIESTYGNSLHESAATVSVPDTLLSWIEKACIQKKGKLIIPAFSVGRTQELLYALNQLELENRLPNVTIFLDSPLSQEATEVVKQHPENFNKTVQAVLLKDEDPFAFSTLKIVKTVDESKLLNYRKEPCVIISASGMAEAGRVKHHIANNIENSRNTILLVGYCEPRSLGGRLKAGNKEVNIYGTPHEVNAEIGSMRSMSAHGDYNDLCQFLACQDASKVKKLFLVHGEPEVRVDFQQKLLAKGFKDIEMPEMHQEFGLG